ncbi:hypothetical protein CVIRNUC_000598 [Coccomyxa viridis]|uniref:Translin n=1 Tax=Coccomyxa viridis TaxID=1274662 RepID=A0AAV1HSB3_9CHLO|nr:hypothetical protein CVIRNUC_000598 [Coccomyxa viridis]
MDTAARSSTSIIPHVEFAAIRHDMEHSDAQREIIIKKSRDVQKYSKQAIFAAHRNDTARCGKLLLDAAVIAGEILPILTELPNLRYGSFSNAMEEYAEARCFQTFLGSGRVISPTELENVERDEYLGGVLDFTGELNRYAVARATKRDVQAVVNCRDLVEGLMGEFLQFDLRNGAIRKKYDSLKYTLRKMENTLYELSLAEAGFKKQEDPEAEAHEKQAEREHQLESL